jgi:hypothetical protein
VNGHRVSDKDSSGLEEGSQRQSMSGTAVDAIASAAESYFVNRPVDRRVIRAGLYARVSTMGKGQATDNQLIQLREFSHDQHWAVIREYEDHESGGKGNRVEFREMLQDAAPPEHSMCCCSGRSTD